MFTTVILGYTLSHILKYFMVHVGIALVAQTIVDRLKLDFSIFGLFPALGVGVAVYLTTGSLLVPSAVVVALTAFISHSVAGFFYKFIRKSFS